MNFKTLRILDVILIYFPKLHFRIIFHYVSLGYIYGMLILLRIVER